MKRIIFTASTEAELDIYIECNLDQHKSLER